MIGLDSEWVRRAMKQHYGRLVSSDRTIFTVLKRWVTSEGDFTYIKGEVNKLQEVKMGRPHASSIASAHSDHVKRPSEPSTSQGAIPFIGKYLDIPFRRHTVSQFLDRYLPVANASNRRNAQPRRPHRTSRGH